jgi:hypothetical protein
MLNCRNTVYAIHGRDNASWDLFLHKQWHMLSKLFVRIYLVASLLALPARTSADSQIAMICRDQYVQMDPRQRTETDNFRTYHGLADNG